MREEKGKNEADKSDEGVQEARDRDEEEDREEEREEKKRKEKRRR